MNDEYINVEITIVRLRTFSFVVCHANPANWMQQRPETDKRLAAGENEYRRR
jgi:hypothetical protein